MVPALVGCQAYLHIDVTSSTSSAASFSRTQATSRLPSKPPVKGPDLSVEEIGVRRFSKDSLSGWPFANLRLRMPMISDSGQVARGETENWREDVIAI
jgi:hypothetical protein